MKMSIREFEQRFKEIPDLIKCCVGQPGYLCPTPILNEIKKSISQPHHEYPHLGGDLILKNKLAKLHKVQENNICITHGASEAMACIFQGIIKKEEEVLLITPSYPAYFSLCDLNQLCYHEISTDFPDYKVDKRKLEQAYNEKCKYMILVSPNNPTGLSMDQDSFESIVEFCLTKQIILIVDRSYNLFETIEMKFPNHLKRIEIFSFSKTYNMTEFRIGYVISDEQIIQKIQSVASLISVGVATCIQQGAVAALDLDVSDNRKTVFRNAKKMIETLNHYDIKCNQKEGYYIYFDTSSLEQRAIEFCEDCVKNCGVLFLPGDNFGSDNEYKVRACMAIDRFDEMLERFETYLKLKTS